MVILIFKKKKNSPIDVNFKMNIHNLDTVHDTCTTNAHLLFTAFHRPKVNPLRIKLLRFLFSTTWFGVGGCIFVLCFDLVFPFSFLVLLLHCSTYLNLRKACRASIGCNTTLSNSSCIIFLSTKCPRETAFI